MGYATRCAVGCVIALGSFTLVGCASGDSDSTTMLPGDGRQGDSGVRPADTSTSSKMDKATGGTIGGTDGQKMSGASGSDTTGAASGGMR